MSEEEKVLALVALSLLELFKSEILGATQTLDRSADKAGRAEEISRRACRCAVTSIMVWFPKMRK